MKLPDFSLVTSVKNRTEMLSVSLPSWLNKPQIKELIIVDWSTTDYNLKLLENLDPRIKIVRVPNKKYFHVAKAHNTGIKHASYEHIIKIDVDYVLNPYISLGEFLRFDWNNEFMTGYWGLNKLDAELGFMQHLEGFMCIRKTFLNFIGGYNESLTGYGWEDTEIYLRIRKKLGLKRVVIPVKEHFVPIYHNPHPDFYRTANYKNKDVQGSWDLNRAKAPPEDV